MHQSGMMAAAALFAIKNNLHRLGEDHKNAKLLANILSSESKLNVSPNSVETNMVIFTTKELNISSQNFAKLAIKKNLYLYPWSQYEIRAVTHMDVNEKCILRAADIILNLCQNRSKYIAIS